MRCIFCKSDSSGSKSVEHVFPESLGNKDNILKPGVVCDGCNQYFAIKIEKPVLETPYFTSLRHRHDIAGKKNRIPTQSAIIGGKVELAKGSQGREIKIENPNIAGGIMNGTITSMIVPMHEDQPEKSLSVCRFVGKIALEALALKMGNDAALLDEIVERTEFDDFRNFVRFGQGSKQWEYHQRRIYPEGVGFSNPDLTDNIYEVLHEVDFIFDDQNDLFACIAIMGVEYCICLSNPSCGGYIKWLDDNKHISPLEDGRKIVRPARPEWNVGDLLSFCTPADL